MPEETGVRSHGSQEESRKEKDRKEGKEVNRFPRSHANSNL
jgi:hypothetical protein